MSPAEAEKFLADLRENASGAALAALGAAADAFKLRPQFLRKQPRARQAEWVRRALSRVASAEVAEEVLAEYFLEARLELLTELLDALDVKHEEGKLEEIEPECPAPKQLKKVVADFRKGKNKKQRELLLRSFAAQSAISWPELDKLLE